MQSLWRGRAGRTVFLWLLLGRESEHLQSMGYHNYSGGYDLEGDRSGCVLGKGDRREPGMALQEGLPGEDLGAPRGDQNAGESDWGGVRG